MSVVVSVPPRAYPTTGSAAVATASVLAGNDFPAWPAWTELSADVGADAQALAGVVWSGAAAHGPVEIEIGVGAAGAEATIAALRLAMLANIGDAPHRMALSPAVSQIPAHARLVARVRSAIPQNATTPLSVETLPVSAGADVLTTSRTYSWPPAAVPGISLTPNATPWANSAWVELAAGFAEAIGLAWVTSARVAVTAPCTYEIDLGYGPAGGEAVFTTIGSWAQYATGGGGRQWTPPKVVAIPANTRLAVRLRKSDTTVTAWPSWGLTYYGNFNPVSTPPAEIDFDPDQDVTGETIGLTWVEHRDANGALHVSSNVALPDPPGYYGGYKKEDVVTFGSIRRASSDYRGQPEGTSFTWTHSDTARFWRGLLAAGAIRVNNSVVIRMVSDEARRALQLARSIVRGLVRRWKPESPLLFRFEAEDTLARLMTIKLPRQADLVNRGAWPNAPDESIGLPIRPIYGRCSDQQVETRIVPSMLPFNAALAGVAGNSAAAHDVAGGSIVGGVSVVIVPVVGGQEGPPSNPAGTYNSAARGVWAGWNAAPAADSYRIYFYNQPWLDLRGPLPAGTVCRMLTHDNSTHDGTWNGNPERDFAVTLNSWADGVDALAGTVQTVDVGHGVVKPTYVGRTTLGGTEYHQFVLARGALKAITELYVDGVAQGLATNVSVAGAGGIWLIPRYAGWTALFGAPYEEVLGRRYTTVYGRVGSYGPDRAAGIVSAQAVEGMPAQNTVGVTVNVEGLESVGDGSGTLITKLPQQYKHWLKQFAFQDWTAGPWLDAPVFPADPAPEDQDVLHMIDEASFDRAEAVGDRRVGGGYVGGGIVGRSTDQAEMRELIASWNVNNDVDSAWDRKTRFFVDMEDDDPGQVATAREYTQERDIHENSFAIEEQDTELFTVRPFAYGYRDADGTWAVEDERRDLTAIAAMQGEERVAQRLDLSLIPLANAAVALDLVGRQLVRSATQPRRARWRIGLGGLSSEIFDIVRVTHTDGIGAGGWDRYPLRVREHEINPSNFEVELVARDQAHVFRRRLDSSWLPPVSATEGAGASLSVPMLVVLAQAESARRTQTVVTSQVGPLTATGI